MEQIKIPTRPRICKVWLGRHRAKCDNLFDQMTSYSIENKFDYNIYCSREGKHIPFNLMDETMRVSFYKFCQDNTTNMIKGNNTKYIDTDKLFG